MDVKIDNNFVYIDETKRIETKHNIIEFLVSDKIIILLTDKRNRYNVYAYNVDGTFVWQIEKKFFNWTFR